MSLELHHINMLKEKYESGVKEQESMITSYKQGIIDALRAIDELKERAKHGVGGGIQREISNLLTQIGGLNQAIANAESKAAEYRAAIQGFDAEAAKLTGAAGKMNSRLEGMRSDNSAAL